MAQFDPRTFVPGPNWDLINALRADMSSDFRARIPEATQANMTDQLHKIMDFDGPRNEFANALVNRIGLVIITGKNWTNPLAKYKRGVITDGSIIEEIKVGLIEAKTYDPRREYLERDIFGQHKVDVQANYHELNRQDYYPITVNEVVLRRAFLSDYGLSDFIQQIVAAPSNSDQWDEFLLTANLFREYYDAGGFFKIRVADVNADESDEADAKDLLRKVRAMAEKIKFPSVHYNAARMPTWADPDELELFMTPEGAAAIDVEALAAAFNIDRARIGQRTTIIPQEAINIPGAQAILTTRDFFVIADTFYDTRTQPNPVGLTQNHFLHHHQIISASRFVPAILFTSTDEGNVITISDPPITSVEDIQVFKADGTEVTGATELARNAYYNVKSRAKAGSADNKNDAVIYSIAGANSPFTIVTNTGTMAVGADETSEEIVVTATSDYDQTKSKSRTFGLTGDIVQLWPNPQVKPDQPAPTE